MDIKFTSLDVYNEGIILHGWKEVELALRTFNEGKTRASRSALREGLEGIGDSGGGVGVALFMMATSGNEDSFIEKLLKDISDNLATKDIYYKSYDYDGPGSFFKTSICVSILNRKEDVYKLKINAAYVGNEPEIYLANYLEKILGLSSYEITAYFDPKDERNLVLDFGLITELLAKIKWMPHYSADEILKHYLSVEPHKEAKNFLLFKDEEMSIVFELDERLKPHCYDRYDFVGLWSRDGNCLLAQLPHYYDSDYGLFNESRLPSFTIRIYKPDSNCSDRNATVYDPNLMVRIEATAKEILAALHTTI